MSAITTTPAVPYSPEAERAVLSCMIQPLNQEDVFATCRQRLQPDSFYNPSHRLLFEELLAIHDAGKPVDFVTVTDHLGTRGLLEKLGGIGEIAAYMTGYESSNVLSYHAKILSDKHRIRQGIELCTRTIQSGNGHQEDVTAWTARLLEGAMKLHEDSIPNTTRAGRMFKEIGFSVIDEASEPRARGITTGFPWLDDKTGGLQPGRVWVISGGTGDGKSAFALQMVLAAANAGHPGDIHSLEMPDTEVWQRSACQEKAISSKVWQTGILNRLEVGKIGEFVKQVFPIRVFDDLYDIDQICAALRLEKARRDIKWAVIDYLQLCDGDDGAGREREVSNIAKKIKQIAQSLGICIITLSQLNDDGRLRESRAIGQHADHVARIAIDEKNDNLRILMIDKNRGGPRRVKCQFTFRGENFQFFERDEQADS